MRRVRVLLAITTALLAGSVITPVASAAAAPVDYVALGDSYVSGTGTGGYDLNRGCQRSSRAYPALWAASHEVSSFSFVACVGASTTDVRNNQLGAMSATTDLVTISIGGNDVGFANVLTTCVLGSDQSCSNAVADGENRAMTQLPARLDATYQAIRGKSSHATIVVVGYPRLFELGPCGSLSEPKRRRLNAGSDVLNGVIENRARAAGFSFADARGTFSGHGVCGQQPWINGLRFPISESYHPNSNGHVMGYLPAVSAVIG